ncbi:MAG: rod shape-determining protein MreD [Bacteroidia bacterium]
MITYILKYFARFLVFATVQVLVLNSITLLDLMHPYLYIIFILILPVHVPRWVLLTSAFVLGLIVDIFLGTPGIHAGASVLLAFLRNPFIRLFKPPENISTGVEPHIRVLGLGQFLLYCGLLTAIHHLFLYIIEAFNFGNVGFSLVNAVINTAISLSLIILTEFIFYYHSTQADEPVR